MSISSGPTPMCPISLRRVTSHQAPSSGPCHPDMPHLSEKALISQRSSSSSATQVSITMGPVCLAGSGFLGRRALERRPFLWGVWVSGGPGVDGLRTSTAYQGFLRLSICNPLNGPLLHQHFTLHHIMTIISI